MGKLTMPTSELAPYPTRRFLTDIWNSLTPYRPTFAAASALRFVSDVISLYPTYAVATLVTLLGSSTPTLAAAMPIFWLWAIALFVRNLTIQAAKFLGYRVAERSGIDTQLTALHHLTALDLEWHERENSGSKLKRIQRGGDGFTRMLRLWVNSYIEIGVRAVGMLIILGQIDPFVGAVFAGFAITFYLISRALLKSAALASRQVNVDEEVMSGVSYEMVANIRTVKVLGMHQGLFDRLADAARTLVRSIDLRVLRFQSRNVILRGWTALFELLLGAIAIVGTIQGQYEAGFLVLVVGYFHTIEQSIRELADNAQEFVIARDAVGRMQAILDEPVTIDREEGKQAFPKDWPAVTVTDLEFSYGKKRALKGISFTIRRGERIGIVGRSGAGKSTLFKLLLKEHESFSGTIAIGGVPIQSIKRSSYFEHAAVVLQDTEVFNLSVRDNIVLANPAQARNDTLFKRSLSIAHVTDFLANLPDGPETLIGEKGVKLSGGEKQRLGIARAIFKQPELLFLDEATSHLDSESESKIQDSLHHFFQGVTAIVIAHRLSTIKEMDRILVMDRGQIVEEGTFRELHRKKGKFFELWEKQRL